MSVGRAVVSWALVRRAGEWLVLALTPLVMNVGVLALSARSRGGIAYDFREAFLPAARAVAHGRSPFGPATASALRAGTAFVYPPVAAYLMVPFTWVPTQVAAITVSLLMLGCAPATLWILGVRDWRCYGASLLWSPVVSSVRLGALTLPLALLVAVAWRHRERVGIAATALGTAVALKLFLWPLLLWPLARRRWRSAIAGILATTALIVVPWAALGFADVLEYPHLLRALSSIEGPESYTLAAITTSAGLGIRVGEIAAYATGLLVLTTALRCGPRRRDATSLVLTLGAALLLCPIVWTHYFALLLVPVAIMQPTFGVSWLFPVALFAFPITPGAPSWEAISVVLALAATTIAASAFRSTDRLPVERHAGDVLQKLLRTGSHVLG